MHGMPKLNWLPERMKKPSLFFRISRWMYFILKGVGKMENEHYLFTLSEPLSDTAVCLRLAKQGWQPNLLGYSHRGQIYQCRKVSVHDDTLCQLHVRVYDDGKVTGHFEVAPEWDEKSHLRGVKLRTMNRREAQRLKDDITGITQLKRKFMVR